MTRRTPPSPPPTPDAAEARTLWQQYRRATSPVVDGPNLLDLAAYTDGRLRGVARDRVEAHLARHPHLLADVIAARAAQPAALAAKPARGRPLGLLDGLGWGAALCGFAVALWLGFATGEQMASAESEAYALYSAAGDENVDL